MKFSIVALEMGRAQAQAQGILPFQSMADVFDLQQLARHLVSQAILEY